MAISTLHNNPITRTSITEVIRYAYMTPLTFVWPLLVPKPNDKWRLCVDYKKLNKISRVERWPIPNIKEMLYRIGDKRPKYFAVLDLTSGYHQIPISLHSRERTAFITPFGLYEWLRLPMGLAGAPSSFNDQYQHKC